MDVLGKDLLGKVSMTAAILYEVINEYDRGDGAWPSVQTLADRLGVSRPTVYKARRELIDAGYITVMRRFKTTGQPDSSLYHFPERDRHCRRSGTVKNLYGKGRTKRELVASPPPPSPSSSSSAPSLSLDRQEIRGSSFGSAEGGERFVAGGLQGEDQGENRPRSGMARLAQREKDAVALVDTFERDRKPKMKRPRDLTPRKRANALVSARVLLGEHRYKDVLAVLAWGIEHYLYEGFELSCVRRLWDEWSAELRAGKVRTVADVLAEAPGPPPTAAEIEEWVRDHPLLGSSGVRQSGKFILCG